MNTSTNPSQGVGSGSINEAMTALLEPQDDKSEIIKQEEAERKRLEEETLEADDLDQEDIEEEDDEGHEGSDESELGDQEEEENLDGEDEEPYYTVKSDGEEYEVTLEELKKGYQLQKDYTQKTQSLAEERKGLDTLRSELDTQKTQYLQIVQKLQEDHQQTVKSFDNVDWKTLKAEDPIAYVEKQVEKQEAERAYAEQSRLADVALSDQQDEMRERLRVHVAEQEVLLKKQVAEFNDPDKAPALKQSIALYASEAGYSEQELSGLVNARDLIILNKARMFDERQAKKGEVRKKKAGEKPSIRIKSSSPQGKGTKRRKSIESKKQTLQRSGRQQDAQALLYDLLKSPTKKRK